MGVQAARRERRRTGPERILGRRGGSPPLEAARGSLGRILPDVARRSQAADAIFRRLLRSLDLERQDFDVLRGLGLPSLARKLRTREGGTFVDAVRGQGRSLAARNVRAEDVVAAVGLSLEGCLVAVLPPGARRHLGLVRLAAIVQRSLLSGYAERATDGYRRIDEQERLKLSRDLHDEVGAELVVLKLYLEMIDLELARGNLGATGPKLQEALALVGHVIESVRRLTLDVGPAILEQIGFLPALRLYARKFSARTGIAVRVSEANLPERLPPGHDIALYRVFQGALSNVVKHARARSVKLNLGSVRGKVLVMVIEDDGVGFDPENGRASRAFGLTAMRERIRSLGGRLHVDSRTAQRSPGRTGTRIEIDLPLREG